ncbi:MAG: TIGR01212 family radical SAM protein [Tissierellia bacterium]|nr:TIGR01212 family radical SAM protein [Tissierellia bacterium]
MRKINNLEEAYHPFSRYTRERFGKKVYKLPIHLKGSCPNRDGTVGTGGCIFCGEEGGSAEWIYGSIEEQIAQNREIFKKRYNAQAFIAYFQNFTGTHIPPEVLEERVAQVMAAGEDIVGITIGTRPDALSVAALEVLKGAKEAGYEVTVELGLQSANEQTLLWMNRCHDVASFRRAVALLHDYGLRVGVHMILDFPTDDMEDVIQGAKLINEVGAHEVKIHNLYILKNTKLGRLYQAGEFSPLTMEEFIERTIVFLEHLSPEVVVGRLLGRAPEKDVFFANWNHSWYLIRDTIVERMIEESRTQGSRFL